MDRGRCAELDGDLWYPELGEGSVKYAKAICARCPVQQRCLEYALDRGETFGVWGGTTPQERKDLVRQRRQAA